MATQLQLDQAEDELAQAGFDTCSAGPINWKCFAKRGGWQSEIVFGFPLKWDLVLSECRRVWPELF